MKKKVLSRVVPICLAIMLIVGATSSALACGSIHGQTCHGGYVPTCVKRVPCYPVMPCHPIMSYHPCKPCKPVICTTAYTVRYVDKDTNREVAFSKTGKGLIGQNVTERALAINGYTVYGNSIKSITLTKCGCNTITFYYTKNTCQTKQSYNVRYLEYGTNKELAKSKSGSGVIGETITESALTIDGYTVYGEATKSVTLSKCGCNVITFYYTANKVEAKTTYTVKYLDKETNESIADDRVVEEQTVGETVTETAIDIEGYVVTEPATQEMTLEKDDNVIVFYYEKEKPKTVSYTVKYLDLNSNQIATDKVVTDAVVGTTVTEYPIAIEGYKPQKEKITWVVNEEGDVQVFFYYAENPEN